LSTQTGGIGFLPAESEEEHQLQQALLLFQQFKEKKQKALKVKIDAQRQLLPVHQFRQQIIDTVRNHRVTIIAADTGAGKSTQVPQYLMEAGFQKIICTQPRRIACISLAKRVAYETASVYGSEVAYQIRFEATQTLLTRILFLTEGVLLRQFASDPLLSQYNVIVVDEVHERHAMGDFLLGILKKALQDREDLKLVLMSATINAELFSKYFNDAPLIEVPGKTYPVEIEYIPPEEEDLNLVDEKLVEQRKLEIFKQSIPARTAKLDPKPYLEIMERIDQEFPATERGDLLIFVSGITEITSLADAIQAYATENRRWIILKLHSTLSIDDQDRVFDYAPDGIRKCIISTNIAETSVTIDGIRFIIDSGRVKEIDYDYTANLSRLSEFWISKASAKQRTGRAGRTGPGHSYRLYSEREFENLNDFTVPEILR
jgi:HrpA-like RNA helicase